MGFNKAEYSNRISLYRINAECANLNLVAFSKLGLFPNLTGQIFSLFTMAVAAEAAVGLAILIALYRNRTTVQVDEMDTLKG